MAKMNILAKKGKKPMFDLYRLTSAEFIQIAEEVLKEKYHFDFKLSIEYNPETEQIEGTIENEDDIPEDILDEMIDDGCNPDELEDVIIQALFCMAGGQDGFAEAGCTDENLPGKIDYVDVMFYARQDLDIKISRALGVIMEGSREQAIIEVNKLLKEVRK